MAKQIKTKANKAEDSKKKVISRTLRKKTRKVAHGIAHVQASFNNTVITITDPQGNALAWATAGSEGFKGSRKSTPFAAQVAAEKVGKITKENFTMISVAVYVNGPGPGREAVIKSFIAVGFKITEIRDVTGIPFNGPRPPKKRRI
jgi:small subunit ribosomal protein S11